MEYTAGERLKGLREMMGLSQGECAELLGIKLSRLKNLECNNCRVGEDEYKVIGKRFPELLDWFTYEGKIDFKNMKASQEALVRVIAAKHEADKMPENSPLKDSIV